MTETDSSVQWAEEFRPTTRADLVGQTCIQNIRTVAGVLPDHMLFVGPPGTGKTTMARIVAKEVFGHLPEGWQAHFHMFNASSVEGIEWVRDILTPLFSSSYRKIILLDEFDRISLAAQEALRNLMEQTPRTTTLILTANRPWRVHEAVVSRCMVFLFGRIGDKDILARLIHILDAKGVSYDFGENGDTRDANTVASVVRRANGDLRQAIKLLQRVVHDGRIDDDTTITTTPDFLRQGLEIALKGDFNAASNLVDDAVVMENLSIEDVVRRVADYITEINDTWLRCELTNKLSETAYRCTFGDHNVHYKAFLAYAWLLQNARRVVQQGVL